MADTDRRPPGGEPDRRLTRIASYAGNHVVSPRSPIDAVRKDAPRAVIQLERERHGRRGRIYRRQCAWGSESTQRLAPRSIRHSSDAGPANTPPPQPERARMNRCPCSPPPATDPDTPKIRRTLPIRHLIPADRLAARSDGLDRDGDRRSRRGTNVTGACSATTPTSVTPTDARNHPRPHRRLTRASFSRMTHSLVDKRESPRSLRPRLGP